MGSLSNRIHAFSRAAKNYCDEGFFKWQKVTFSEESMYYFALVIVAGGILLRKNILKL
jgi:hypothetical protein